MRKPLKFRRRVCKRCEEFYLSSTRKGKYCNKCKKKRRYETTLKKLKGGGKNGRKRKPRKA